MVSTKQASARNKFALSFGLVLASAIYAVWQHTSETPESAVSPAQSYKTANDALQQTISQIRIETPPSPSAPASNPATGAYTDGSYTGNAEDAYYGTVQVKAIVQNGALTDVQFLQYPNDRSNSRYINGQAMPLLTQEAISAQSAQVDGVSGATFTSEAFKQSLASALALAKK